MPDYKRVRVTLTMDVPADEEEAPYVYDSLAGSDYPCNPDVEGIEDLS